MCSLIKVVTKDSLVLDGYFSMPPSATLCVVHIHGASGNFYSNSFIQSICSQVNNVGCAFLSFNNRGSGRTSYIDNQDTGAKVKIGGTYEIFEECILDIAPWIKFLREKGIDKVILQGHSMGCHKAALYCDKDDQIDGLILISPSDIVGWQWSFLGERYKADKHTAMQMIDDGKGGDLMPNGSFPLPISAESFNSWLGDNSLANIFNYYNDGFDFKLIRSLRVPMFVCFGTENEVIAKDVTTTVCLEKIKHSISNVDNSEFHIFEGAPHSYKGHEELLAERIAEWIKSTFK